MEPPARGSALYRYLVRRLFASFDLPLGPLRYLLWMWLPKGNRLVRGVSWRTIRDHWPGIRADLDGGTLSPLGVVRARGNPLELGRNHQVLAFGYDLDEPAGQLILHVYDPNHPGDDGLVLRLHLGDPARETPVEYRTDELPVYGFFRTRYRRADVSALRTFGVTIA
jgi:hypothetical protein